MNLDEMLLQKLAEWRPAGDRQILSVTGNDGGAAITADRCDPLGCLVWELRLTQAEQPGQDRVPLATWAEQVAGRVTGLLEPLEVLEVDADRQVAMLRSRHPSVRGGDLFYYEMRLEASGQAHLRRYHGFRTSRPREQITFALTHEALAKLAHDVVAA